MASEPVFMAHYGTDQSRMFFHSSSYTANPIACAAANANLAIWEDEPVAERVATLATRQAELLDAFARLPGVGNPRQAGTIIAFDVVREGATGYLADIGLALRERFRQRDVLLRPLGNTVYVMPPYCIGPDDLALVEAAVTEAVEVLAGA
jgi:adenosylmethionine-8-amino-7-oxononanoate aminotransferase